MKRVLIYTHEFLPFLGGLAATSFKLAKGLGNAGLEVTVLAPTYSTNDRKLDDDFNFKVVRMGKLARNHGIPSPIKETKGFFSLQKTLSEMMFDVIIFITREAHIAGGLLPEFPFKVIVRVAGYEATGYLLGKKPLSRLLALPMKRLYMKAHKIISPSNSTRELLENARIPKEKIRVIYNGITSDMLVRNPKHVTVEKLRKKFNIHSDDKVILTVGRLVPGKGQDTVIRALSQVLKEYDSFKYVIVGEGGYEQRLKSLADKEGIKSKIIFVGPISHNEVVNFYDLCDLFIMPNRIIKEKENIEGLPNVVLEAASRGKPVITGAAGGAKEVIQHGKSGYVVDGENLDSIAAYILDLLNNADKSLAFGTHARQRIEENFTEEKMIDEYLRVFDM